MCAAACDHSLSLLHIWTFTSLRLLAILLQQLQLSVLMVLLKYNPHASNLYTSLHEQQGSGNMAACSAPEHVLGFNIQLAACWHVQTRSP